MKTAGDGSTPEKYADRLLRAAVKMAEANGQTGFIHGDLAFLDEVDRVFEEKEARAEKRVLALLDAASNLADAADPGVSPRPKPLNDYIVEARRAVADVEAELRGVID